MTWFWRCGAVAVAAVLLGGCAAEAASGGDPISTGSGPVVPSDRKLTGRSTVLQKGAGLPQLCLGFVAESYPPQCTGPILRNWDWSAVNDSTTAAGVTWGSYAVTGTWDGREFTLTETPIALSSESSALPGDRPLADEKGAGSEPRLSQIQRELQSADGPSVLASWIEKGYLVLHVIYDDGDLQREMDGKYGHDLILVQSALSHAD
ncbi:MAG: hypothetical protein JWQ75_1508 [Pseudarthrobacter sp.]|nr:hypothetical protein [Pseudarthrobacter sp.]